MKKLCLIIGIISLTPANLLALQPENTPNTFFDLEYRKNTCPLQIKDWKNSIYLLYDVNPVEGFNLRRDVYIRLAVFVHHLRQKPVFRNVRLVLPPWPRLYHWKSRNINQHHVPWQAFFDMESLRRYAPVLDFPEFVEELKALALPQVALQQVFQLQQFADMFENGVFHEKYEIANRNEACQLQRGILEIPMLKVLNFTCVRYQGNVNLLERLVRTHMPDFIGPHLFGVLNAEIVLHDHWGDREFWRARRSMRFSSTLVDIANRFRQMEFNSNDTVDRVQRPVLWEMESSKHRNKAKGGPYLCAHLRRGDFVRGRAQTTPTLRSAAIQIKNALQKLHLKTVFLATDADAFEVKNLKSNLPHARVVRFTISDLQQKMLIMDGGRAIIDQLVCAHAQYFIGTYESTFTYRIYEEREILGFPKETTFNTFCKNDNYQDCPTNSKWPIVY